MAKKDVLNSLSLPATMLAVAALACNYIAPVSFKTARCDSLTEIQNDPTRAEGKHVTFYGSATTLNDRIHQIVGVEEGHPMALMVNSWPVFANMHYKGEKVMVDGFVTVFDGKVVLSDGSIVLAGDLNGLCLQDKDGVIQ